MRSGSTEFGRVVRPFVAPIFWASLAVLCGCADQQPRSPFADTTERPLLLAHRGVAQTFALEGVTDSTCTARQIHQPRHAMLENTLPSIGAAVAAGADVVEVDVHPTTDGEFAVFHDWTLECRTNGAGRTRDHPMSYLKTLDIGYGYTADGGKMYPFRAKAVGMMPSLKEVLLAFPGQPLLINVKSKDPAEGRLLADYLNDLAPEQRRVIAVYGGDEPVAEVRARVADGLTMSRSSLKVCLGAYVLVGWSGAVPKVCERMLVLVPSNYTRWLWGWHTGFVQRMRAAGSAVYVLGPYAGGPSSGIDTLDDLAKLPPNYSGGIWTNEIALIGAAVRKDVSH